MTRIWNLVVLLGLWPTVIAITFAAWILPVPFQATILFFCGLMHGRMLAKWI